MYISNMFKCVMNMISKMDDEYIKTKLREWIEEIVSKEGYSESDKDFLIQYGCFHHINDDEETDYETEEPYETKAYMTWQLECIIPDAQDESFYDINVNYSDTTSVDMRSIRWNYDNFTFTDSDMCYRYYSSDIIYAIDLYPNFVEQEYTGSVSTRCGWKWLNIYYPGG